MRTGTPRAPLAGAVSHPRGVWYALAMPVIRAQRRRARRAPGRRELGARRAAAVAAAAGALFLSPPRTATAADPPSAAPPPALRRDELAARLPLVAGQPARVDEVARGRDASVNFWQLASGMPAHLHRAHEEIIVVIEGTVEVTLGPERIVLGPGDSVLVPRDAVHAGRVLGDAPARGYSVFAPPFDGADRVPAPAAGSAP